MAAKRRKLDTIKKPGPKATDWRPGFIAALCERPFAVGWAAAKAGINRSMAYHEKDGNPAFAEAWHRVIETALDEREHTLWESTAPGAPKHENMTGLIFLLKARRKAVYGGVGDGPAQAPATVIFKDGRDNA